MPTKNRSRISLLKNLFQEIKATRKKNRFDYFGDINGKLFILKERLRTIDNEYFQHETYSYLEQKPEHPKEVPQTIQLERDEILRKINIYSSIVAREYDREYINARLFFWSWFFR